MRRLLYRQLIHWRDQEERKPLLLQGARQVGKTYLLKEFGRQEYADVAYFNFEKEPQLGSLFEDSLAPEILIHSLSAVIGRKIKEGSTLIFFDEIQACPRAITSLKYFCEEAPGHHVVGAGSLLGVSVGKTSSFPVGKVSFLNLYPMSFFEYLDAVGEAVLLEQLTQKTTAEPLPQVLHDKLLRLFRYYLYLGGMPEVVQHYISHGDIEAVRKIQNEILQAYERDFSKYASASQAIRISEVWHSIPRLLAKEKKKFKYSEVRKGGRAARFESAIEWLRKSGLIHIAYNLKVPKLPLSAYADESKFKVYALDTGILGPVLDVESKTIVTGDGLFAEYNGAFVENYVAGESGQAGSRELYYWTSRSEAEVDFIIAHEGSILPLEVKSGMSRRTKSLHVYAEQYGAPRVFRTSPRNFTLDGNLMNFPLYAISLFPKMS